MMTAAEFADLLDGLVYVLGPLVQWGLVFMVASTGLLAVTYFTFALIRRLYRGR